MKHFSVLISLLQVTFCVAGFYIPPNVVYLKPLMASRSFASFEILPDLDRARHCVGAYGECSLEELETLRNDIHQDRIKHIVRTSTTKHSGATSFEDTLLDQSISEERRIERDLSMQLDMLRAEMVVPRPKDTFTVPNMNGNLLEGMVWCAVLAIILMAPNHML